MHERGEISLFVPRVRFFSSGQKIFFFCPRENLFFLGEFRVYVVEPISVVLGRERDVRACERNTPST